MRSGVWLISYDIADPRRLRRVHRCVSRHAMQVQFSVYLFRGTSRALDDLLQRLRRVVHPTLDDVRIYPVPARPWLLLGGRTLADADLFLLGDDAQAFVAPSKQIAPRGRGV